MTARPTSWPCPIAFEDATAVVALAQRLRDPDAAIFALRLWHHRRRCGATVPDAATLEGIARWRRKHGELASALVASGFVIEIAGGLEIRSWEEVAAVDWTRSGADEDDDDEAQETDEDRDEHRRALARERSARFYARKREKAREAALGSNAGEREKASESHASDASEREKNASNPRARTCATATGTNTATEESFTPSAPAADSEPSGSAENSGPEAPAKPRRRPPETGIGGDATRWLRGYCERTHADFNEQDTPAFRKRYASARKVNPSWTAETLERARDGCLTDLFWAGKGPLALLSDAAIAQGLAPTHPIHPSSGQGINAAWGVPE